MKVYILSFTCSVSRAIYLEIFTNQAKGEFIKALKRLVARRGRPHIIYLDNAKTLTAAEKWINKINKDEHFKDCIAREEIRWKFNVAKVPWWGGQFERTMGLTKQMLYKSISELEEIALDIEINLNKRPLTYVDDIELSILTPNSLIYGHSIRVPGNEFDDDNTSLLKRQRYIKRCKQATWNRWKNDYLRALLDRHDMKHKPSKKELREEDIVTIKSGKKNRGKWKIGIVQFAFVQKRIT